LAATARSAGFGEDWGEVGSFHHVVGLGFLPDLFEAPAGLAEVPGRLGGAAGGSQRDRQQVVASRQERLQAELFALRGLDR